MTSAQHLSLQELELRVSLGGGVRVSALDEREAVMMRVAVFAILLMASFTAHAAEPPAKAAGQYASVHGLKLYYEVHGTGAPLVLLHGGTDWIGTWPQARDFFAKQYQVITPEQMGHGRTADDASRPFDYHAMAEDTVELLRQLHVDSAFFLGWSDGGNLALDIASNHPALVKKVAVTGASIHPFSAAKLVAWAKRVKAECGPGDKEWQDCWGKKERDEYLRVAPDPKHFPAFLDRVKKMWLTEPNFTQAQLAKIVSPAFITAADRDGAIPLSETIELFEAIPGARLWVAPNATHSLPLDKPEEFNAAVGAFFEDPAPK